MKLPRDPSRFSFGSTSATITSLGLIIGLLEGSNPRASIIGALLLIAVADNIAGSLGFHIYRESTFSESEKEVSIFTFSNFIVRFGIVGLYVLLFAFLPLEIAALSCVVFSLAVLISLSYLIGVQRKTNPLREILIHVGVAIPVILVSHFLGQVIFSLFG